MAKRMMQESLFATAPTATFSECVVHPECPQECKGRPYRYTLEWAGAESGKGRVLFILANPSTATHLKPDPTVTRCITYGTDWGYARVAVGNARAYRSTEPKDVPPDPEGIGPENDRFLIELVKKADLVVCGWGKLGGARGPAVLDLVRRSGKVPHALARNADGSPQHPLYLAKDLKPAPM